MAMNINLAYDEAIILKNDAVAHGGITAIVTDELILTNKNIYCVKKNMLGRTKGIYTYPLKDIKVVDGIPQVTIGKLSNGTATLEIYFLSGCETFHFQSVNRINIKKWQREICNLLSKNVDSIGANRNKDFIEIDPNSIAGIVKEGVGEFASALGIKVNMEKGLFTKESQKTVVNKKCISCSAPLIGEKGQVLCCKYCDTEQTL